MTNSVERALVGMLLAIIMFPSLCLAVSIVSKEEAARLQQVWAEKSKAEALLLRDEAEQVFTGRLFQLTRKQEVSKDSAGRELVLQTYQAVFDFVDDIKGKYVKGQVLEFTVDNRVSVGGSLPFRRILLHENGQGESYLVYAASGKILRTSHIPFDVQPLKGYEEVNHLRTMPPQRE